MTATFSMKKLLDAVVMDANRAGTILRFEGVQASISVSFEWTSISGTKDGVFQIQACNKQDPGEGDWETKASYTLVSGDATSGVKTVNVDLVHEALVRVRFLKNSVSGGTLTAYGTAKKRIG